MRTVIFIIFSLGCNLIAAQQKLQPFSQLSGQPTVYTPNITKINDGYLIQNIFKKNGTGFLPILYKLNSSGKIIDSMIIAYNGKDTYSDEVIHKNGLNYQLGFVAPSQTVIKSPKRCLIVFDDNFKIIKNFEYDILPTDGFPNSNTSNAILGDTIISVRNYGLLDSLLNPLPGGRPTQIERFGINGEVYGVTTISPRAQSVTDAVVVKDRIFVFGWVAPTILFMNVEPVGEYMLDGTFIKTHTFSGGFHGGQAIAHKSLIYHSHQGIIDQRNAKFELLKSIKLKNETVSLSIGPSYKPYAFDDKDNLFYLHYNQDTPNFSVFKLNASLELKWEKNMGLQGEARFVIGTDEGGCLVGFVVKQTNGLYILKMYKLDDLGNVTSVESIEQPIQRELFYPNPFQSQLTLQKGIEGATQVGLYDTNGRIVGTFPIENNSITVDPFLPVGTYIAQLKDATAKVLGVQMLVKE
jgi:hypothetical protein